VDLIPVDVVVGRCSGPSRRDVAHRRRGHEVLRAHACALSCSCHAGPPLVGPRCAWPAAQARGTRSGLSIGCETSSRYHVGSRVRRGQPLGAEVLLAVPTAGRNPFRGTASCLLARARALSTLPRPTQTSVTVTGLKSTKNEPTAQHTPQSKPMRLDCLTVRCVRSEDQPRTRHPRLTSLQTVSAPPAAL
jgi:hypothetical protein